MTHVHLRGVWLSGMIHLQRAHFARWRIKPCPCSINSVVKRLASPLHISTTTSQCLATHAFSSKMWCRCGGAENASTGECKYGKGKYETAHFARTENACTENASTENASTMQTFNQIKKFGTSEVSVVHFQVRWASGLQIVFI